MKAEDCRRSGRARKALVSVAPQRSCLRSPVRVPTSSRVRDFSWHGIWVPTVPPTEIVLRAVLVYLVLLTVLRVIPRKELGRYSISDIIVLFLVATAVRRSIVVDDNSVTTAFVGLVTIFAIDQFLGFLSRQTRWLSNLIQGRRVVLVRNGVLQPAGIARAKMTDEELLERLRSFGAQDVKDVAAAYLERDGKVTFVFRHPRD